MQHDPIIEVTGNCERTMADGSPMDEKERYATKHCDSCGQAFEYVSERYRDWDSEAGWHDCWVPTDCPSCCEEKRRREDAEWAEMTRQNEFHMEMFLSENLQDVGTRHSRVSFDDATITSENCSAFDRAGMPPLSVPSAMRVHWS